MAVVQQSTNHVYLYNQTSKLWIQQASIIKPIGRSHVVQKPWDRVNVLPTVVIG